MKKVLALVLVFGIMLIICSCDTDPYKNKRPISYPNTIWVCEEYDASFSVDENREISNASIPIDGKKVPFTFLWAKYNNSVSISFLISGEKITLGGKCAFSQYKCTIAIDDTKGYFPDKKVEMVFLNVATQDD